MLTIAEILSFNNEVDFLLGTHLYNLGVAKITERVKRLHGLNLSKVNFVKSPIGVGSSFLQRLFFLKNYDWLFYLTDGSIFLSTAKNNIVHFQVPFENTGAKGIIGRIKLSSWKMAIYNSHFTKNIVEKSWPISGSVIYPPVSVDFFIPGKKKKQILSVGRFFGYLKDKKHSLLIDSFKRLVDIKNIAGWSLYLAGGAGEGDKEYVDQLKQQAKGYPIYFYPNATLAQLKKLYAGSSIYWHAAGFAESDPKRLEHFGITTVEAMSAGAVPVVINSGGQKEIVGHQKSGFLWNTKSDLENYTMRLIRDSNLRQRLSKNAAKRSKIFSKDHFCKKIYSIL